MGKSEPPPEQFVSIGHAHDPQPFNARAVEKLIADLGAEATARPGTVVSGAVDTPVTQPFPIVRRARWLVGGVAALFLLIVVGTLVQHDPGGQPAAPRAQAAAPTTLLAHPRLEVALRPQLLPDAIAPRATAEPRPRIAPRPATLTVRDATADQGEPPRLASTTPPAVWTTSRVEPSFDCSTVRNLAEELVCTDPELAGQDRALASAYRRALEAGAPRALLRRQQERWTAALDEAAHEDPGAMPQVYSLRIDELNAMAERDPLDRDPFGR